MITLACTVEKAFQLLQCYQALHGLPKAVKGNGQGAIELVPFVLSGNARVALNENVAALLKITRPHEDVVATLHVQYRERLAAEIAKLSADQQLDAAARAQMVEHIDADLDAQLQADIDVMLKREKTIELEPLRRRELNEAINPFYPPSFATLLNEELIEGR